MNSLDSVSLDRQICERLRCFGYRAEPGLEARIAASLQRSLTSPPEKVSTFGKDLEPGNHRLLCLGAGRVAVARKKTDEGDPWKPRGTFKTAALALNLELDPSGERLCDSEEIVITRIKLVYSGIEKRIRQGVEYASRFSETGLFVRTLRICKYSKKGEIARGRYLEKLVMAHPRYRLGDLGRVIKENNQPDLKPRVLTEHNVLSIADQLLQALSIMERSNCVHRDIKPGNMFLHKDPDGSLKMVVGDLDSICEIDSEDFLGRLPGTRIYLPPESFLWFLAEKGVCPYPVYEGTSQKGDVWAAGLVLRELCGFPRFSCTEGDMQKILDLRELPDYCVSYNDPLNCLIQLLLTVDAEKRPTAAEAFSLFRQLSSPDFLKLLLNHALQTQNAVFIKRLLDKKPEWLTYLVQNSTPKQLNELLSSGSIPSSLVCDFRKEVSRKADFDTEDLDASCRALPNPKEMLCSAIRHRDIKLFEMLLSRVSDAKDLREVWQVAVERVYEEALRLLSPRISDPSSLFRELLANRAEGLLLFLYKRKIFPAEILQPFVEQIQPFAGGVRDDVVDSPSPRSLTASDSV